MKVVVNKKFSMRSLALIGVIETPGDLIGWQEALLFLIWKAKQSRLMDFFGVGRTIKRMIALPNLYFYQPIITAKLKSCRIMGPIYSAHQLSLF